jgi:5-(carboxyamino)imidazole ribonucleotide synthase
MPAQPTDDGLNQMLEPGSTIGILGTGQLGRMLAGAAAKLGFRVEAYGPEISPPAAQLANEHHAADYTDIESLRAFAHRIDAATFEFENIPPETVRTLIEEGVPVRPDERILAVCQDRVPEKKFLREHGFATAPFADIQTAEDLEKAVAEIGPEGILKTRRFGYDGKGQVRIRPGMDLGAAFAELNAPSIYEGLVEFDAEVSLIAARSVSGDIRFFDMPHNDHSGGILRISTVPANLPIEAEEAKSSVCHLLEALDYVGVMTVEFFWSKSRGLIANEIAPRVHNSGHWTHEACAVSQFEQHIRAVAGWPLGDPVRHSDAVMANLIGMDAEEWAMLAEDPALAITLYGKSEARMGRKMGHTVKIFPKS